MIHTPSRILITSKGAGFGHRLYTIYSFMLVASLRPDLLHKIYWDGEGCGDCLFEDLFVCKLPNIIVENYSQSEEDLISQTTKDRPLLVWNRTSTLEELSTVFCVFDLHPLWSRVALLANKKEIISQNFGLSQVLVDRFRALFREIPLTKIRGFQIRCREGETVFINRENPQKILEAISFYLNQIPLTEDFYFCSDSFFAHETILKLRPKAYCLTKTFSKKEASGQFVTRSTKEAIQEAVLDFTCLLSCKERLPWPIGGWTQFEDYWKSL